MKHITEFVSARTSRTTSDSNASKPKPLASILTETTPIDTKAASSRRDDDDFNKLTSAVHRLTAITSRDHVNPRITRTRV
eukprot:651869-Prorocentrum_minimum.AAC.2